MSRPHSRSTRHGGPRRRGRRGGGGVSKFIEPGVLLLLSEGNAHGYELSEELGELLSAQRVDVGNLYRLLRKLEDDGLVTSEWDDGEGGRAKRVYELTDVGSAALDEWAQHLQSTRDALNVFLDRHGDRAKDHPADGAGDDDPPG